MLYAPCHAPWPKGVAMGHFPLKSWIISLRIEAMLLPRSCAIRWASSTMRAAWLDNADAAGTGRFFLWYWAMSRRTASRSSCLRASCPRFFMKLVPIPQWYVVGGEIVKGTGYWGEGIGFKKKG